MFYICKKNTFSDYLFWNARTKIFSYSGGTGYASLESAKKAFSIIVEKYRLSSNTIEILSHEAIINSFKKVTSLD